MSLVPIDGITLWAARDLLRRPGDSLLTGLCIFLTTALVAVALLLSHAVSDTALRILSASPSMVVRRVDPGGWMPVRIQPAAAKIRAVPGVVSVQPRLWGAIPADGGVVTVVGANAAGTGQAIDHPLQPGEAWVGPGVEVSDGTVYLGKKRRPFSVAGRFRAETAIVAHDLVLLTWQDAGAVLGIAPGFASDMAVEVFHPGEAEALAPELAAALPWEAAVTTRTEAAQAYSGSVLRRGSLAALVLVPAVIAMVLLVVQATRERFFRKQEVGLLRALGWETFHLVRLHLVRSGLVAVPSVLAGALVGYGLVFWPGVSWPSKLFFGWSGPAPHLYLSPSGALQVVAGICALILLPLAAAAAGPVLKMSLADPRDLVEKKG